MNPLSGVLSEAFDYYKRFASHLLTISFVVYLTVAVVNALLTLVLGVFGALIGVIVSVLAVFLLQSALVKSVEDIRDGRADLSLSETLNAAKPYLGNVAIAGILAGIAIGIGLVLCIVPGLFLVTIWAFIVPVIVLEGVKALDSFGRSQSLVKGHFWQVFVVILLTWLILVAASILLGLILTPFPRWLSDFVSSVVSGTLFAPFIALAITLSYYRLSAQPAAAGGYGQPGYPEPGYPQGGYGAAPGYGAPGYGTPGYPPPPSGPMPPPPPSGPQTPPPPPPGGSWPPPSSPPPPPAG